MPIFNILRLALPIVLLGGMACTRATERRPTAATSIPAVTASPTAPAPTPDAASEPSPSETPPSDTVPDRPPLVQFSLSRFHVTGPIVSKDIDPVTNTMESPDTKDEVAYYTFSPLPDSGCQAPGRCANTVLAGHVDFYPAQVGIFWHLKDTTNRDEIRLTAADGGVYRYRVVASTTYPATAMPMDQILAQTPEEAVTLITCDGSFDKRQGEYDECRVVRATRVS